MFTDGVAASMAQMGLLNGTESIIGGTVQISILDTVRFTTITITRIAGIAPWHSFHI